MNLHSSYCDPSMTPSEKLKSWRVKHAPPGKKALSQELAAAKIGATGTAWCEWENGNKIPDTEKSVAIEKIVGIPVKEWAAAAVANRKARGAAVKRAG